jgi:hypothetical protein
MHAVRQQGLLPAIDCSEHASALHCYSILTSLLLHAAATAAAAALLLTFCDSALRRVCKAPQQCSIAELRVKNHHIFLAAISATTSKGKLCYGLLQQRNAEVLKWHCHR